MPIPIHVHGWHSPPPSRIVKNLTGRVVHIFVGGMLEQRGTSLAELTRFAKVTSVQAVLPDSEYGRCPRCASEAVYRITVEWEAGFISNEGDVLCESCVNGVVTQGVEHIAFPPNAPSSEEYAISVEMGFVTEGDDA